MMKSLMLLSASQALDTPDSGKFLYLELDKNIDFLTKGKKDDYNYMYHANVFAGSKSTKTELWITSQEHQVAFFSPKCTTCELNGGWDPSKSTTGNDFRGEKTAVEVGQVYDMNNVGKKIIPNVFYGNHWNDTLKFLDPSTSEDG